MNIINNIYNKINQLPEHRLIELLAFIEFLNYKEQHQSSQSTTRYDFSDLSGQLQWQGNALQEQKKLRNEW
jgi:hypothetical protein